MPSSPSGAALLLALAATSCAMPFQIGRSDAKPLACTDLLDCQAACAVGQSDACLVVGDAMSSPDGAHVLAASAYLRACESGDRRACSHASSLLSERSEIGIARDLAERLVRKLSKLCDSGDDSACSDGLDVAETWDIHPLQDRLARALERRCDAGNAGSCLELLESNDANERAPADTIASLEARVESLGRAHCTSGAETACTAMKGLAERRREENAALEQKRRQKLTSPDAPLRGKIDELGKKCAADQGVDACVDLATIYLLNGMRVAARHTFDAACDSSGAGLLCWNAFLQARDFELRSLDVDPWVKLHAACAGGVQQACELDKVGASVGPVEALTPALVVATANGDAMPFGVTRAVVEPGSGPQLGTHDRALVRMSAFATDGTPLDRSSALALVTADRIDAIAEALTSANVGARVLARVSPGALSPYAVPVTVSLDVIAVIPRGPVRTAN